MSLKSSKPQLLQRPRLPVEGVFCCYSHRTCMQNRLEGYSYCARHILEDKNAPYKQCSYVSTKSGKRCPNAAHKMDKREGYCPSHARKAALLRQQAGRKKQPRDTPETLLSRLESHVAKATPAEHGRSEAKRARTHESVASRVLDYASSSDSDAGMTVVDQAWRGDADSDAESIDSEQEDPLKHAGVYTAEEVALITRDKLIRLQSLYIDQFKRLQHVMRERRRRYLQTVKIEKQALGSIHRCRDDPEQREKYEKLMAMKRHHRRFGKEALMYRQSKERRIATSEGSNYKAPAYPKCIHVVDGSKCAERTVPLSKFCPEHIMNDPHQVLFQTCCYGNGACVCPVPKVSNDPRCMLHVTLANLEYHLPLKREPLEIQVEEGRDEPPIDVVGDNDIKQEPDTPEVTFSLAEPVDSAIDRNDDI
ncbi:hypothetical protein NP493_204g09021 [Ridgeia piscesae]|uniref:KAT8 regulatory NSL complex subunit 2 n=1 Tax=Ridgeia piscesae TaxID=27915 RepID=A0AAD9P0U2_RIDPI|nr:hypothetical protein NP493_204g09021 [Ridgeia piscesae]